MRKDALGLVDETDDGSFLLRETLFHQRHDVFPPHGYRRLAAVPIRQAANPLGDDDAVGVQVVGHGDGAAVDFFSSIFGQNHKRTGADFFEGGGFGKDGTKL